MTTLLESRLEQEIDRLNAHIRKLEAQLAEALQREATDYNEVVDEIARLAAPADLVRRLLADHQRVEPHYADMCQLCREATAAIEGQPAPGSNEGCANCAFAALHVTEAPCNACRAGSNEWQPAQGERHQVPCTSLDDTICPQPAYCHANGCKEAQGERQPVAGMICAKCGVDRLKNCCPNHCEGCPMIATAHRA